MTIESQQGGPTAGEVAEQAVDNLGRAAKAEISRAQDQLAERAVRVAPGAIAFGTGALFTCIGFEALALSPALHRPLRASLIGLTLLGLGGVATLLGYRWLPADTRAAIGRTLRRAGAQLGTEVRGVVAPSP